MIETMELDRKVCSRARLSRDPRFDGKFYVAVLSTGIYCRPICRAPTAKEVNVRYYPSAAAAAEAGFRPCLRCRPECSPGTPAWAGTPSTVSRALRLIGEAGLEDGGVENLAARLGIGSRHLRRLFLRHLGATPSAVAQTRRLHFAKKLIDETTLPMGEVAMAAGFGSVRRFNAWIRSVYDRTPTQIRHLARNAPQQPEDHYVFQLRFRPPYDWDGMLAFLAPRAIPGVEAVEAGTYRRSISLNGAQGSFQVSMDLENSALAVRVQFGDPQCLFTIIERVRAMFDLNADWSAIAPRLKSDPVLARQVAEEPGLRVPGCWNAVELVTRAVLGQQVSVRAATTLAGRIAAAFGQPLSAPNGVTHLFPSAEVLAESDLRRVGLTRARAETVRLFARAVCKRQINFSRVIDTDALLTQLCEIPGIGQWTAQYVAMRALGEPDAFPFGDLGLLKVLGLRTSRELERRAESWRPWRAYAAMYLWSIARKRQSGRTRCERASGHVDIIPSHHELAHPPT